MLLESSIATAERSRSIVDLPITSHLTRVFTRLVACRRRPGAESIRAGNDQMRDAERQTEAGSTDPNSRTGLRAAPAARWRSATVPGRF